METNLRLLMPDGTVQVLFRPKLAAEQYEELLLAVEEPQTVAELEESIEDMAERWGVEVHFDD